MMKPKFIQAHMEAAEVYAKLSTAKRLQVGSVVVKDDRIISIGYNGMPSGWTNVCENDDGQTKPEVLHAETNAIAKIAKGNESADGATLFCTHAPCIDCAKLIYQSGISSVYYKHDYRSDNGVQFLKRSGVHVSKATFLEKN
jgi:dCMP deaminase